MKLNSNSTFSCSFCLSTNMELIMDFGKVALAGAFLKKKNLIMKKNIQCAYVFAKIVLLCKL